jgi:hypothetical protein
VSRISYALILSALLVAPNALADDEAPAPAKAESPKNEVVLHVASPDAVSVANSETGEVVCTSPCDKPVPSSGRYKIVGARPSPDFTLTRTSGKADVKVKPGSKRDFWLGVGGLGLGGALIGTGVTLLIYGVETREPVPGGDGETTDNTFTDLMALGTTLTIAGTVAALWGGATVLANAQTKVRGDLNTARIDVPRSSNNTARSLPKATSIPLFVGTF